jgi:hypothetical protein
MTWRDEIAKHYDSVWRTPAEVCELPSGPIRELPSEFSVLRYQPHGDRSMWTYATCCMSQPEDQLRLELHIFSPYASDLLVELLVVTAHYHRTGNRLGLWHTVNFGRAWLEASACSHGFISLPYLDGPRLEDLNSEVASAKCYWLVPVTPAEAQLKQEQGTEALEGRFDRASFNYIDPMRPSVV